MSSKRPSRQELIDFWPAPRLFNQPFKTTLRSIQPSLRTFWEPVSSVQNRLTSSDAIDARTDLVFIHTDGACRGNPGPSGAGWVFSEPGGQIFRRGKAFLGRATNNEAEYVAVILALEDGLKQGFEAVKLHADSELLIKQVTGVYRVKNPRIKELYTQLMNLARQFKTFQAVHVRREFNAEADLEANKAIDAQKITWR